MNTYLKMMIPNVRLRVSFSTKIVLVHLTSVPNVLNRPDAYVVGKQAKMLTAMIVPKLLEENAKQKSPCALAIKNVAQLADA